MARSFTKININYTLCYAEFISVSIDSKFYIDPKTKPVPTHRGSGGHVISGHNAEYRHEMITFVVFSLILQFHRSAEERGLIQGSKVPENLIPRRNLSYPPKLEQAAKNTIFVHSFKYVESN